MNEQYTKLAQKIVYSSLWEEDGDTCKIWVTLLALKDQNGVVTQNITGIARLTKIPVEKVEEAFRKFSSPDPRSTSGELDGRRLVKTEVGWAVVNHQKYKEYGWSEEKKAYERNRKAAQRFAKKTGVADPPEVKADMGKRFVKPTREELNLEAAKMGLPSEEVDKFVMHYESNGWKVGKNPMRSWRHSLAGWGMRWREKMSLSRPKNVDHRQLQEEINVPIL